MTTNVHPDPESLRSCGLPLLLPRVALLRLRLPLAQTRLSGSFHPPHIDSKPPPSALTRAKRLENVIKLRMTLNVITEKMLGADLAMLRQQELFAFFSARSGKNRASVGGGLGALRGSSSFTSVPGSAGGGPKEDLGGSYISINVDRAPPVGADGRDISAMGGAGAAGPGLVACEWTILVFRNQAHHSCTTPDTHRREPGGAKR